MTKQHQACCVWQENHEQSHLVLWNIALSSVYLVDPVSVAEDVKGICIVCEVHGDNILSSKLLFRHNSGTVVLKCWQDT